MNPILIFVLVVSLFAPGAVAQGLVWSQPGTTSFSVAITDEVLTASHLVPSNTRALSLVDGSVTRQDQSPGLTWTYRVAGHASIFDADIPGTGSHTQRVYVRTPTALYQFPATSANSDRLYIASSRDGSRIAAVANAELMLIDSGVQTTIPLGFTALGVDISADGSSILVTGDMATRVFAAPSLAVLFSATPSSYTFHAQAISGNGDVFAIGRMGRVDVWRRTAGVYGFDFQHTLPGVNFCDRLDVSDDGSTLAAAFNFFDTNRQVTLDVVDLNTQATVNSASYLNLALANVCGDVSVSADGQIIALGMWGDGSGPAPEVVFFRRGAVQPIASFSIAGSACDLDLSADGRLCAVGTKDVHATDANNAGSVELYRVLEPRRSMQVRESRAR